MRRLLSAVAIVTCVVAGSPASADDIDWEVVHPFRFFKYESDFEIYRLAYEDLASRATLATSVLQMDHLLNDPAWWDKALPAAVSARYDDPSLNTPSKILMALRKKEIADGRAKGAPELAAGHPNAAIAAEYDFRRMGWASLLFPFHQKPEDIGKSTLVDSAQVAVCWQRAAQQHSNCPDYIKPAHHTVSLKLSPARASGAASCVWTIESGGPGEFVGAAKGEPLTAPCNRAVQLRVPFEQRATVKVEVSGASYRQAVQVRDVLVVSLGDSFASGEGNPDVPAKIRWTSMTVLDPITRPDLQEVADPGFIPLRKRNGEYFAAQWIDRSCHRSAYSYPVRSAIQLALQDKHRAVTFLGYACSGAEINEGLFNPFLGPEGTGSKRDMAPYKQAQLSLMLSELCGRYEPRGVREEPIEADEESDLIKSGRYTFGNASYATAAYDGAYRCAKGSDFRRPIDILMLSIGGNDVGFAKWITAAITPYRGGKASAFLPILKGEPECKDNAGSCREMTSRWQSLKARHRLLREFIDERVTFRHPDQAPVLVYTYPAPTRDANNVQCKSGNSGMTLLGLGSKYCLQQRQNGIPTLGRIETFVSGKLNPAIADFAKAGGKPWRIPNEGDDFAADFQTRGFCATDVNQYLPAGAETEPQDKCYSRMDILSLHKNNKIPVLHGRGKAETLHIPRKMSRVWQPYNPALDFAPYQPRQRWLRTSNDVYVLINQQEPGAREAVDVELLGFTQSAVYGSFHPTAEAHARTADSFVKAGAAALKGP